MHKVMKILNHSIGLIHQEVDQLHIFFPLMLIIILFGYNTKHSILHTEWDLEITTVLSKSYYKQWVE